jgi:shikimate kinase
MNGPEDIRLIGPGGAGKSTIGALLAERRGVPFLDLDRQLVGRVGDISEYISRHGYDAYARENVETYCSLFAGEIGPGVVALSSGFMTYVPDIHPEYLRLRREIEQHLHTYVLLPSLDHEVCVAETVRRQITRPFARSSAKEEAVIRSRLEIYMAVPARKIETMCQAATAVDEIVAALSGGGGEKIPGVQWMQGILRTT